MTTTWQIFTITVDPESAIVESNESNNQATATVSLNSEPTGPDAFPCE